MKTLDNEILKSFKEIAKRLILLNKQILSSLKIKLSYYKVLSVLSIKDNISQTVLGDICTIDKPATSRLVNNMKKENLITKSFLDNNKKNVYISATPKGKQLITIANKKLDEIKNNYFCDLQDNDKKTLLNLLNKTLKTEGKNA